MEPRRFRLSHPRWLLASAAVVTVLLVGVAPVSSQRQSNTLPPISMTCPHHPDVIESKAGQCPLCSMALVPVRLDSEWMCPVHSVVHQDQPGTCRLCRRPLVPVTMSLTWTCRGEADAEHLDPGTCRDGTPRMAKRTLRPHGNHNPQHGGQFFMAPDNWHHLEGTYPRDRTVRIYIYDDYARALGSRRLRDIRGRIVTQERFDPATRQAIELRAFALRPSRDGTYLEARIDGVKLPAEVTAKLRFGKDAPEYRFDFTFREITRDPNTPTAAANTAPASKPTAPLAPIAPTSSTIAPTSEGAVALTAEPTIAPANPIDRLRELRTEIAALIEKGDFGAVWVPAFAAKDLAVALEAERPDPALSELVRTAWLLDAVGDAGNRQEIEQAFNRFTAALTRVNETRR